ncbi:MAG: transporter substrate-binding domain-containing protein [Syntrophales bacterium]|jgi:PAS domain S-box-containing protein|nr:transporter substrate-binding domain-containing protein [Syntrophales bacterium]
MITGKPLKNKKIAIRGVLALLIALSGFLWQISDAFAEEKPQMITAGVLRNFPPYHFFDQQTGQPAGFAVEVLDEVAKNAGLEVRYIFFDEWPAANKALREGRIDVIPDMGMTEERKSYADFTHPYETFHINIFIRETDTDIRGIDDLRGRNVAVVAQNMGLTVMQKYKKAKPVIFPSLDQALLSLLSGNTDALVYPELPVLLIARQSGLQERIKIVGQPLQEVKRAMAVKRGKPELLRKLDAALQTFIATSEYKAIYARWHVAPAPYWNVWHVASAMAGLLFLVIVIFATMRYIALRRLNRKLQSALEGQENAEKELHAESERRSILFENSPDGILIIDPQTAGFLAFNTAAHQQLGYSREEFARLTIADVEINETLEDVKAHIANVIQKRSDVFETLQRNRQGEIRNVQITAQIVDVHGQPIYHCIWRDITDRKRAEEKNLRLAAAIEQSGETVLMTDLAGIIQYVNPAFERITGYTRQEAMGKNPRILKSGRQDGDFYKDLWENLSAGRTWKGRFVNRKKSGDLYDEDATISPVRNLAGEITHYVAVKRDITEQLKTERQLLQAQKMEAIGTMSGGIAHDFNNILGAISGYTELSLAKIPPESRIKYYLEQIQTSTQRAVNLVRQILEFSRLTEKERKPVSLLPLIKETVKMLREIIPATIEIRLNARIDADTVLGDATQIYQILMNLCTNAYQSMKEKGGLLEIDLLGTEAGEDIEDMIQGLKPGPYVEIIVRDTGEGIDPLIRKRIFDPFFTTKKIGEGTGLGLSVVHGIVRSYGGKITVESQVGAGSAFHVYLPLLFENPEAALGEVDQPGREGTGRILLVDDEEMLVNVTKEMLEERGYTVTAGTDSVLALEAFRAHPEDFDLVITDQTMPVMTGLDLARALISIRPDIPIILCTGFLDSAFEEKATEAKIREVVLKPVKIRRLIASIHGLLAPSS